MRDADELTYADDEDYLEYERWCESEASTDDVPAVCQAMAAKLVAYHARLKERTACYQKKHDESSGMDRLINGVVASTNREALDLFTSIFGDQWEVPF